MKKIVLFLNQDALSAYRWSSTGALPLAFFPHGEDGRADFRDWLSRQTDYSYCILTDLVEEDLQHESVPHLTGRDQKVLCERKLNQLFRSTPYRRAKVQIKGKRGGQDSLQLSALTSRELLDQILAELMAAKAIMFGVYSVALLTQEIMARLKLDTPHLLMMSCNSPGQLRQSYFTPEGLRFSRLATFHAQHDMPTQADMIAAEIIRARQYLSTLRLMGREEPLTILALFDTTLAEQRSEILRAMGDDAGLVDFSIQTDMADLARRLKLPAGCQSWHDVLVAMLVKYQLPNHYAPPEAMKYHSLHILGRGLAWSSMLVLVLAAILAAHSYSEGMQVQEKISLGEKKQQQALQQQRQFTTLLHQAAASEPDKLQVSAQYDQQHLAAAPQVEATLKRLSHVLQDFPSLSIDEINWQAGATPTDEAANLGDASSSDTSGTPWLAQRLVISGRVQDRQAYRAALAEVNKLIAALKTWPQAQVLVKQWPIDIRSESAIKLASQQSATNNSGNSRQPDFVIELMLPAPASVAVEAKP